ncbi:MAG: 50S ribosomal protein L6 [Fuerstiella sp.]|jgi:large subunit ribosomal protein L6|nr:50S ribosomal protein L6 [Fuerstiella sp.]
MSRIGNKPISFPPEVAVALAGQEISVKGAKGDLKLTAHPNMVLAVNDADRVITVSRPNDLRENRALHGLTRSLIQNMVDGVVKQFERRLTVVGVGYNASLSGRKLSLQVGFANTVVLEVPEGVDVEVPAATSVIVRSADKQAVGQFAANIRQVRPPEPYKGKGIRYENEQVRRKAGKAFGSK